MSWSLQRSIWEQQKHAFQQPLCDCSIYICIYIKGCFCAPYSWRYRWYAHFPRPDRCSPASSSFGSVSPRSPPRHMKTLHRCHSNAQLQHREKVKFNSFATCQDGMQAGTLVFSEERQKRVKIKICAFSLTHWTAAKYVQEYQMQSW